VIDRQFIAGFLSVLLLVGVAFVVAVVAAG